jgi:hypothetical protein
VFTHAYPYVVMIYIRPRGRRRREAGARGGLCGLPVTTTSGTVVDKAGAAEATAGIFGTTVGGAVTLRRPARVGRSVGGRDGAGVANGAVVGAWVGV